MASRSTGPQLNAEKTSGLREWYSQKPTDNDPSYITYYNDFIASQDYAAADWTITTTEAGAGAATEALTANDLGGSLLITNDDADNDLDSLQQDEETWKMASGKRCWYETRIKIGDADDVDLFVGLGITDTTPLVTADRAGFQIDDANASILCKSEKNATETSTDSGQDAADATYVTLGMYWDGISKLEYYVDRSKVATHTTNIPDDVNMAITMHVQNGSAAANTLTVDYIQVTQER